MATESEANDKAVETTEIKNPDLIRSKKNGCFLISKSEAWGRYITPTEDPDGMDIPSDILDKFFLIENFPKVSQNLWSAIMSLFFEMCDPNNKTSDSTSEVSIIFCRKKEGGYQEWRVLVPTQEVGSSSVNAKFEKLCDIITGEETTMPPDGFVHSGSAHSHNTMSAFFSSTDNDNELSVPGLHVVVGKINTKDNKYELKASIVLRGKRYDIEAEDVIELIPTPVPFHPNVRKYITKKTWGSSTSSSSSYSEKRTKFTYDEEEYAFLLREDPIEIINSSIASASSSNSSSPNTPSLNSSRSEKISPTEVSKISTNVETSKQTETTKETTRIKTDSFFDQINEVKLSPSDRRKLHQVRSLTAELIQKSDCKELIKDICSFYYFGREVSSLTGHDTGWGD